MDMLCKYKKAFSLTDEIVTCQNTEVKIDIMERSPFLVDHMM